MTRQLWDKLVTIAETYPAGPDRERAAYNARLADVAFNFSAGPDRELAAMAITSEARAAGVTF